MVPFTLEIAELRQKGGKAFQKIGALLGVLAAALALMLVSASPVMAATFTVTNLNDSGAGSLRQAIIDANALPGADTIVFDVIDIITLTSGPLPTVTDDLTIEGPGATDLTISGNNTFGVLEVALGVTLNLEFVTVANGSDILGGGVLNNGTLTVFLSTLLGNSAGDSGGGIYNNGTLTITSSSILGNSAAISGGGIYNAAGTTTVTNSSLISNSANLDGGGIYSEDGAATTLTNSTLSGNTADDFGGGIYNAESGSATLTNSTLSGNSAPTGGGIANVGMATVTGSTLSGNSAPNDGGGIYNNSDGTLSVTNSTLSGNSTDDVGGGIYNAGGTLDVAGSTLSENSALNVGGIANVSGIATVSDSTLSGNTSGTNGGGIYNSSDGTLAVTNSTLSGNTADDFGGGIYNTESGSATLTNSTLSGNSAPTGGGIANVGMATVTGSTLSGNSAPNDGGGIYNSSDGTLSVTNSTLSGNSTDDVGGGIYNAGGTLDVANSTLSGNSALAANGGGIANGGGTTTLINTIVANSPSGGNCAGVITDGGGNLSWPDATCPGINEDPLLGPLQDNGGLTETMALSPGSPAIDAAVAPWPATDQRGVTRPQGPAADIGAFELEFCVILIQEKWNSLSGAPGDPQGDVFVIPGGLARNYEVGRLICNEATGQVYWLYGPILAKYDEIGAYTSPLRLPVSDVENFTYWARATFEGGWIYWWPARGAQVYRNSTSIINNW